MEERPKNLLIICPDEMRGDCAGFMGNPDIRTPHIDSLAERSIVFENHFACMPKCVPARISFMTGRYTHTDGYRTIYQHMLPSQPNLLSSLRQRGYQSALFGKNHCWDREVFDQQIDFNSYKPPFDRHMGSVTKIREHQPNGRQPLDLAPGWNYIGCNTRHSGDEAFAAQAAEFLTKTRDKSRPFFLQINFESPHPVYGVEEPYYSMYDREAIRPWPHELPRNAPLPLVKQREFRTGLEPQQDAAREVQAVYYGMISKVDALVAQVLQAIDSEDLWKDTVVLFWSDHGDYAGQHTLAEKWDTDFRDCITHVPFTLCAPELPRGLRVDSLTDHTEIAPTLCELLGLDPLPGMHGRSLLPVIRGEERRDTIFSEGGHEDEMLRRAPEQLAGSLERAAELKTRFTKQETYYHCPDTMARAKMVRTDRYKLVVRLRGGNELYDLQEDPWEMDNRWGDPALQDVTRDLLQRLVEWSLRTDTDQPYQEGICS